MSATPRVPAEHGSPTDSAGTSRGRSCRPQLTACAGGTRPCRQTPIVSPRVARANAAERLRRFPDPSGRAVATRTAPGGSRPGDRPWPAAVERVWDEAGRGRLAESIAAAVQGACAAAVVDDPRAGRLWSVAAARLLMAAGRLSDARAAARCSLHMLQGASDPDLVESAALDVLARVALSTGDPAGLTEVAHTVTRMCASPLAEVTAAGDWLGLLLQDARSQGTAESSAPTRPTTWFGAAPDLGDDARLARILVRAGHSAAADALLQAAAQRATGQPDRIDALATHHAVAGVVQRDRSASLRAASLFGQCGQPLAVAAAREDAAAAPGPGGPDPSVALLVAAIWSYDHAGARMDAARARAVLGRLDGHERPPSVPTPRMRG